MKTKLFAAVLCALLLTACAPAGKTAAGSSSVASASSAAPASSVSSEGTVTPEGLLPATFSTQDLDGNTVDETIFSGHKLTMLNVWATYCGPCINEMPELGELAGEYADKGVQILGLPVDVLNTDGTPSDSALEEARGIVEDTKAAYTHLIPNENFYSLLATVYGVPTTLFFDENGQQVGEAYVGARSKEAWADILDTLLAKVENA